MHPFQPPTTPATESNVATLRTGVNLLVFTLIATLISRLFNVKITVEDLLPWSPIIAATGAIFYRLSRVLSEKYPWLGYVLFGTQKTPTKYIETTAKES